MTKQILARICIADMSSGINPGVDAYSSAKALLDAGKFRP